MSSQKGFAHILLIVILLAGLIGALFVIKDPTNLFPKAAQEEIDSLTNQLLVASKNSNLEIVPSEDTDLTPTISLSAKTTKQSYKAGEEIEVQILIHSDTDFSNLFIAKLKYDSGALSITNIDDTSSVIKSWVEKDFSTPGSISLVGGYPNPGLQTKPGEVSLMATIKFRALKDGIATIIFDDGSSIYRNLDNVNVLKAKNNAQISIGDKILEGKTKKRRFD